MHNLFGYCNQGQSRSIKLKQTTLKTVNEPQGQSLNLEILLPLSRGNGHNEMIIYVDEMVIYTNNI